MSLLDLPVELLYSAFEYLTQRDIKSLRLVCRATKAWAKLKFDRVFISPNSTNISAFKGIVAHPDFNPQVREIVWDDAQFERYVECKHNLEDQYYLRDAEDPEDRKAKWLIDYMDDVGKDRTRRIPLYMQRRKELWGDAKEIDIKESFIIYCQLYEEQESIIASSEDVNTLRLGLISFPNLQRITLTSETWRYDPLFPRYETPLFRSLPPGFRMPIPWPWFGALASESSHYREWTDEEEEQLEASWDQQHQEWRGYSILVSELLATASHHKVREFVIDVNREPTGISQELFCGENVDYSNTINLFETLQLTRLDLALNTRTVIREWTETSFLHRRWLKRALSNLTNLEHFHFRTSILGKDLDEHSQLWVWGGGWPWIDLADIFPTPYEEAWPRLHHLVLANLLVTEQNLFVFLSSLPALRDIDLDSIILAVGEEVKMRSAQSLLRRLKANLVEAEEGAWRERKPRMTIRYWHHDTIRLTYFNDVISEYLYGNAENPFDVDEVGRDLYENVSWWTNDFDDAHCVPHKLPWRSKN